MTDHVLVERKGPVQIIRMNRPDRKNAITRAMYATMAAALSEGDADPEIRVHAIFGTPGAFSSGNDISDFMVIATGGEGVAVGIGTTIHLHCDLTFATPRTEFRTPFVDLGLVPEAGSSLLAPAVMGRQNAFAMLGLGIGFSAERARETGLIYEVVPEDRLEDVAIAAAEAIAAKPPEALKISRDLMRQPRERVVERIKEEGGHFRQRLTSDEARNAFMAFMNRKKG